MLTTVRRDGEQSSVGEIQTILNFQFLITSPTTLLVNDSSHLRPMPRRRARGFRGRLLCNAGRDGARAEPSLAAVPERDRSRRLVLIRTALRGRGVDSKTQKF